MSGMDNDKQETDSPERRRGRPPGTVRPSSMMKTTMLLDPEDTEWAKTQPEGLSGLVRRLLAEAHEKAKGKQK